MEKEQVQAMKCNFSGIIEGLRDQLLREIDDKPSHYDDGVQTLFNKGQHFTAEDITEQFNTSYERFVNDIVKLVALSLIDKDNKVGQ